MTTASAPALARPARTGRSRRRLVVRVASAALTLLLVAAWTVLLRPEALGGPATYVIVSGSSMLPSLETGDLVVAFERDAYAPGDVVVYEVPSAEPGEGTRIVHRVIGLAPGGRYVVQGDNREGPDYWRPTSDEILGRMAVDIPQVGAFLVFLRTALGVSLVAALATVLVALAILVEPARPPREPES